MSMMTWTINGRVFEMMEVAEDEMVHLHDTMAWEWINNTPIPHPRHGCAAHPRNGVVAVPRRLGAITT